MGAVRLALWAVVVLAVATLVVKTSTAHAQVHVGSLRGPRAAQVRAALLRGLERAGQRLVDREDEAAVAVSGRVVRRGGRWRGTLVVSDAAGAELGRVRGSARRPPALGAQLARRLASLLEDVEAQAPVAASDAEARPWSGRVVVGALRGRGAARVRAALVEALGATDGVALVPREELEARGEDLADDAGLARAMAALQVSAFVTGSVVRRGRRWVARLRVRSGDDGREVGAVDVRARSLGALATAVRRHAWERLGATLRQTSAGSVPAAAPAPSAVPAPPASSGLAASEETRADAADEPPSERPTAHPNALDVAVLGHPFARRLRYNDDLYGLLREYTLRFGPAVRLAARWYPGAHFTAGWGAHVGVELMWERAFAIDSKRADGEVFPTRSQAWRLGLRGRVPLGRHEVSLGVGYGRHTFVIDSAGPSQPGRLNIPQIPGVDYRGLAMAAEARLAPVAGLRIMLRGAYVLLVDLGGIASDLWFPRAKAAGIEAGVVLGWETPLGIELRLGWDVRRYFFRFDPEPGDPFIAGGAVDQYFGYTFGLGYRL